MKKFNINVTKPFLPNLDEFLPFLESIWNSKILTNNGDMHQELEFALKKYLGVENLSLVSSGTMGLILALKALNITGEVITTPYTYIATTNSILWAGAKPCFVDIEPHTLNINPFKIEAAVTSKTTAILAVHCYGNPCEMQTIESIARKFNLKVIYDAAHFFYPNSSDCGVLNHGDMSVLSFHATKIFNTFEGGAVISRDANLCEKINRLKNFGLDSNGIVIEPGINGKLNEFQAALGLLQLRYIDTSIQSIGKIDEFYRLSLEHIQGISCLGKSKRISPFTSYFPIFIGEEFPLSRDELYEYMKAAGALTRKYFYPLTSSHPCFMYYPSAAVNNLPVANSISKSVICLPMYPDLSMDDQRSIINLIQTASIIKK